MEKFYIVINNEQKGPFSVNEILKMDVNQNTLGWNENYDNWTELKNIEQFKIKLSKKPPPIPKTNDNQPLKVILTKEKKEKKNRKKIDYTKIFTSLFLLLFVSIFIGFITFIVSNSSYGINKFDNYDYSKVTITDIGGYNFPLDKYSPTFLSNHCDDDQKIECLKANVKRRKEIINRMSGKNGIIAFGISYFFIVLIYLIMIASEKEKTTSYNNV